MSGKDGLSRRKILVSGTVQGVGFRPFVYRLATSHGLAGWVRNTSTGVEIDVEGSSQSLELFVAGLTSDAPELARVETVAAVEAEPSGQSGFRIIDSKPIASADTLIPADIATCQDCLNEVESPSDHRNDYPFTNCTNCGPRFTIVERLPYDRANTTMSAFEMCDDCAKEYGNPTDRRFHAEPTACPVCGPRVWLEYGAKQVVEHAIEAAATLLLEGRIVAIKGIGGFHLACDASNEESVRLLRTRKGRVEKPFAVMVKDLTEAERVCEITEEARRLLNSKERPITLARKQPDCNISVEVAPGNNYLGLLLPYSPLHALLLQHSPAALVMTSGNFSEEPLVYTNGTARARLTVLADALLLHDRDIHVPCDDSVVRPVDGVSGLQSRNHPPVSQGSGFGISASLKSRNTDNTILIRRARGFAPNPIELPFDVDGILGCGAEQKNTFCVGRGKSAIFSQHVGDLDTIETYEYYRYVIEHFRALLQWTPRVIAHDLHPDYMSTEYALDQSDVRLVGVQHHHAHIASCMAENGRTERVIGVALDGTGYGTDGTVWGGEILDADLLGFTRLGHLELVRMPGGEAAIREPRRMAAAYLRAAYGEGFADKIQELGLSFTPLELEAFDRQLESGLNSPFTSSAGRLFDAVSAAIGVCVERSYEGQPALELEMVADEIEKGVYPFSLSWRNDSLVLETLPIFRSAVEERLAGVDAGAIAARFHNSLAALVAQGCEQAREKTGLATVALSGGVFQNAVFLTRLRGLLEEAGFEVLAHRLAPPNDGGIALGQVAVAASSRV